MRGPRPFAAVLGAFLTLLVLVLGIAPPAAAHTTLIGQSPKPNATVAAPSTVTLTFADRVIQPGVVVRDPSGTRVDTATTSDGPKVSTRLAASLPAGRYQVGWRVVAPDGHVQTGKFRFTVAGGTASSTTTATPSSTRQPADDDNRASGLWWTIGGVVALLVIAGAVITVRRVVR